MMIKPLKNCLKIGILTGGFDPITPGHIEYFKSASKIVDKVIVYANSDEWLSRKKGKPFMKQNDRLCILNSIKYIHNVFGLTPNEDADNTACGAIRCTRIMYPNEELYFMNGGDRDIDNIPEHNIAKKYNVSLLFGIGGTDKKYSSSWYLREWVDGSKS